MPEALTQQELESRLWAAANSLRGPVDPSDFKAYIFPLLFYKRLSDGWDAEHGRALADYGGDETLAAPEHTPESPRPGRRDAAWLSGTVGPVRARDRIVRGGVLRHKHLSHRFASREGDAVLAAAT